MSHRGYRETPFESFAHAPAIKFVDPPHCLDGSGLVIDDPATHPIFEISAERRVAAHETLVKRQVELVEKLEKVDLS